MSSVERIIQAVYFEKRKGNESMIIWHPLNEQEIRLLSQFYLITRQTKPKYYKIHF